MVERTQRDVEDAESILVRRGKELDREYLEGWCRALGVEEELREMKREVEELMEE